MSDTQLGPHRSTTRPRGLITTALVVGVVMFTATCGLGSRNSTDAIDSEVFIQAFVDLRTSALDTDSQRLATLDRDAILSEHGVSVDDLTHFADSHGRDLDFMRDVWNEVELRLDRMPAR